MRTDKPTLRDWTAAHNEPNHTKRLQALTFLHDRMHGSHIGAVRGWLYVHRWGLGAALVMALGLGYGLLLGTWEAWLVVAWLGWELVRGVRHA